MIPYRYHIDFAAPYGRHGVRMWHCSTDQNSAFMSDVRCSVILFFKVLILDFPGNLVHLHKQTSKNLTAKKISLSCTLINPGPGREGRIECQSVFKRGHYSVFKELQQRWQKRIKEEKKNNFKTFTLSVSSLNILWHKKLWIMSIKGVKKLLKFLLFMHTDNGSSDNLLWSVSKVLHYFLSFHPFGDSSIYLVMYLFMSLYVFINKMAQCLNTWHSKVSNDPMRKQCSLFYRLIYAGTRISFTADHKTRSHCSPLDKGCSGKT